MNRNLVSLFSSLAIVVLSFSFTGCKSSFDQERDLTKKDIMDRFVAGGELETDYIPGAFFVHFPKDAKVGQAAVEAHLNFYNTTNPDILKVQFEQALELKYNDIPGFFEDIIKPFDLRVMNRCIDGTKMNILHICDWEGTYDDLTRYVAYPGDIVNTPNNLNGEPFTLNDGYELFKRPVLATSILYYSIPPTLFE